MSIKLHKKKGNIVMAKGKTLCNVCGKEFSDYDEQEHIGLHSQIGYGSKHDGDIIDLDICCDCFDVLIDKLAKQCKINPIQISREMLRSRF